MSEQKQKLELIPMHEFLEYEIRSSWWASWIGWNWLQQLGGTYFAYKVSKKYARYYKSKYWQQKLKNEGCN